MKKPGFFIFFFCFLLIGCEQNSEEFVLGCLGENCQLVYDGSEYLTYNPEKMTVTGKISEQENDFQYRMYNHDDYITHGNSFTNGYKIMNRENELLRTVYAHKNKHEAIYPFACINGEYIFSVIDYSNDTQEFAGLFRLTNDYQLEQINTETNEKAKYIFGTGISVNGQIYTFLNENEKQNLYKTNLSLSEFELIAEDVSGELSTLYDDVCYIKSEKLFCGREMMKELSPHTASAWVLGNKYILEAEVSGHYTVQNLSDQRLLHSGKGFIGFDIRSSKIIIYCDGDMRMLEAD